jgi:hypothetical protein
MIPDKRRSKLEERFEQIIKPSGVLYGYEITKIPYTIPESSHQYIADWTFPNKLYIETKGYLSDYTERRKYVMLKEQHPELDLRFVFVNPKKLCGGTKMTHGEWADKYGFQWCSITDRDIILKWIKHEDNGNT